MPTDPNTIGAVAESTNAVLNLLATPLRWIGTKLGITSAPQILLGPLESGALPNETRAAYQQGYYVIRCLNSQRLDWRSRLLTTQEARRCRGTIRVINSLGHGIKSDDILICGSSHPPRTDISLPVDDNRYHIPILATISSWVPHHVSGGLGPLLQPGSYLLGSRFFNGLCESERLPVGNYTIQVSLRCANGDDVIWTSSPVSVATCDPSEPDIVFSLPQEQPRSEDLYEKLNVCVRTSRRFTKINDVRLLASIDGRQFPMQWSVNNGKMDGEATATLYPEQDVLVLVAAKALSPHGVSFLGGAQVGHDQCYLTDISFRVNKKPSHQLIQGVHDLRLTAIHGTKQFSADFVIAVPSSREPLRISRQ